MRPRRYSGAQQVATLKQQQAANNTSIAGVADTEATFPKVEPNFNGLGVWEASRLKALEEENVRLKKLLAEAVLMRGTPNIKDLATNNAEIDSVLPIRGQRMSEGPRLRLLSSDET